MSLFQFLVGALYCIQVVRSQNAPRNAWLSITSSANGQLQAAAPRYDNSGNMARIYLSRDGGNNFYESISPKLFWETIGSSASGSTIVAGHYYGELYVSLDTGFTWKKSNMIGGPVTPIGSPASGATWRSIALSNDGNFVVAASTDFIWVSRDSGVTFSRSNSPDHLWTSIACNSDCSIIVAASYYSYYGPNANIGKVYISRDQGNSWEPTSAPLAHWYSVSISANGRRIMAVTGEEKFIYSSSDSGLTWREVKSAPSGRAWNSVVMSNDGLISVAASSGAVYCSVDLGIWKLIYLPSDNWLDVSCDAKAYKCTAASINAYDGTSTNGRLQLFDTSACVRPFVLESPPPPSQGLKSSPPGPGVYNDITITNKPTESPVPDTNNNVIITDNSTEAPSMDENETEIVTDDPTQSPTLETPEIIIEDSTDENVIENQSYLRRK